MVHACRIKDGKVSFSSKLVRTARLKREESLGFAVYQRVCHHHETEIHRCPSSYVYTLYWAMHHLAVVLAEMMALPCWLYVEAGQLRSLVLLTEKTECSTGIALV